MANFMRLSLLKAAHAIVGWGHVQEIRGRPSVPGTKKTGRSPTKEFHKLSSKIKGKHHKVRGPNGSTGNWTGAPGSPGFPVELVGVGELHAAFLTESRTRNRRMGPRTGNPGRPSAPGTKKTGRSLTKELRKLCNIETRGKDQSGETHPNRQEEARPRSRTRSPRSGLALRGSRSQPEHDPGDLRLGRVTLWVVRSSPSPVFSGPRAPRSPS